jgi:hypothetical protein
VVPVELEQMERAQDHVVAVPARAKQIEHGQAVGIADDGGRDQMEDT